MSTLYLLPVANIELDTSIQCRATIAMEIVNAYADAMAAGDAFPPIEVYGTNKKSWIGDGWHRFMAAQSLGLAGIEANLNPGTRLDALKHALGANACHGHRRSNEDKRRTVEIALREFPKLADAELARMCGVTDKTIAACRPVTFGNSEPDKRIGADGKQYPAHRQPKDVTQSEEASPEPHRETTREIAPLCDGMRLANAALMYLGAIRPDDLEREQAFAKVEGWIRDHRLAGCGKGKRS